MKKFIFCVFFTLAGCAQPGGVNGAPGTFKRTEASVFWEGSRLATGESWSRHKSANPVLTAHRTLPLGSWVQIRRGTTCVNVQVRDRGPAAWTHRDLDLSLGAAALLGVNGTAKVEYAPLPSREDHATMC